MIALQSLTAPRLAELIPAVSLAEARKILAALTRDEDLGLPLSGVRRVALDALRAAAGAPRLEIVEDLASSVDPFRKFVLRTADGQLIETVRIPLEKKGRFSICVSSQAGCALGCVFCATGRLGLARNLESWEIIEQVRVARRTMDRAGGERVHGVVFQGMGEPLANVERVLEAIAALSEPCGLAIDARNVTVCTSGIPSGIRKLADACPKVRLGLSIASARPDVRRRLMPIDKAHPLEEVIEAAAYHARVTGLMPMWAVTPLAGVNDGPEDALALARLARRFAEETGLRPRVSLVPYNQIDESADPFARSADPVIQAFRDLMASEGVVPHVRYSGGGINAGCGQLAARA